MTTMKARFRGGPWDGQEREIQEALLEISEIPPTGKPFRYVLGLVDRHGVHHYYVPSEIPPPRRK
jgi:hypothetical protein